MMYLFEDFELDPSKVELRRAGHVVAVEPQVFALLLLLAENRERLVTRDEIIEKVWDGRIVSDSALDSRVKSARRALGDDGKSQRFIRTIHGQGFRFVAEIRETAAATRMVEASTPEAAKPSIAVLPFRLVGDAGPYAAIADGLADEMITELSRLRWIFVIARGSSFRFRSPASGPDEIGRLLGVRYCLSGTVEISGAALVVTVQLTDTRDSRVVWADRFASRIADVHDTRWTILARVVAALELQIPLNEARAARLVAAENLDAWAAYHLGLQHMFRFNRADNAEAGRLFEHAIGEDPQFARAHAGLSFVHFQNAFLRYSTHSRTEIREARRFAERAIEIDAMDPFANLTMGRSYWLEGRLDDSFAWVERATTISPNYAQGIYSRAWTHALSGRGTEGREDADTAMLLSPLDPLYYAMAATRALSHVVTGEQSEAAAWSERAARSPGAHVLIGVIAIACHSLNGNHDRAAAWAANVHSRSDARVGEYFFRSFPFADLAVRERVAGALARYGI